MQNINKKPRRKNIRLKDYNYSLAGDYFITICSYNRECIFGEIIDNEMVLNDLGKIIEEEILNIPKRFKNVGIDIYAIMPNHVHLIISILSDNYPVVGAIHELPLQDIKMRRRMLIPRILGYFKMNSAKKINQILKNSNNSIWQRNYYEHIIRNEKSYDEIYTYIESNPQMWDRDRNNPKNFK